VVQPDGGIRWVLGRASPAKPASGSVTLALGFGEDITERKLAEEKLRESEERFRLAVQGVKEYAICMLDLEGRIVEWNPGGERIFGYRCEEIGGAHFSRFYPQDEIERDRPAVTLNVAVRQGTNEEECWQVRKDGSRFWADVVMNGLRDNSGQLRGFRFVVRDYTERKRAEEALLLEVTNAMIAHHDISELLAAIRAGMSKVIPHDYDCDYVHLALYDPEIGKFRLRILHSPEKLNLAPEELLLPLEGSPAGIAFKTREPLILDRLDTDRFRAPVIQHLLDAGVKSLCILPLIRRGRPLGTIGLGSSREARFSNLSVGLLMEFANQVALAVDNAAAFRQITEQKERLAEEKQYLEDELRTEYNFQEIIGESAPLRHTLKQVETVAPTDSTVLVLGETGTGKELLARAIHNLSPRKDHPFIKVNCAAIPLGLLESELFGHERGAFTGAIARKIGRFEVAHEGTLFLDEVGDIPLELQPKLLRVLQEQEFERLGSTRTIRVNVRVVAATSRDLLEMVETREFRSDLYYRLNIFPVVVPPLRERVEDIPLLVASFVEKYARLMNKRVENIPTGTLEVLSRYHWPGNVRELQNFIERSVILTQGSTLRAPLKELKVCGEKPKPSKSRTLHEAERDEILRALQEAQGVLGGPGGAAERLGLKRTTLYYKMRRLGIARPGE
jgi:formate hydrogenlyase transcriptional activator